MIPGDLLSAFPHRQFHTLPDLLDSWAALPNSYPNALRVMQGGSLYHFYDGLWYDPAERRTHDLPCERRTRYRLSQPDTVLFTWTLRPESRNTKQNSTHVPNNFVFHIRLRWRVHLSCSRSQVHIPAGSYQIPS